MSDQPIEDRVQSRKGDSPAQRLRTAQLRAQLGLHEHPEWSAETIAEEYGTHTELVEEIRSPDEWDRYVASGEQERQTYATRVADEFNERKARKERMAAFKRLAEGLAPKRSLIDRILRRPERNTDDRDL